MWERTSVDGIYTWKNCVDIEMLREVQESDMTNIEYGAEESTHIIKILIKPWSYY